MRILVRSLVSGSIATVLLAARSFALPVPPIERGMPVIQVYEAAEYGGGTQNFSVTEGERDVLFVGNLWGIIVWDGEWWRQIEGGSARYAVAAGENGVIAWGGVNELGILEPDANGALVERSLVPELDPAERRFGDVTRIAPVEGGFLYLSDRYLFLWDGRELKAVSELEPGDQNKDLFPFPDGEAIVRIENALYEVEGAELRPLITDPPLRGRIEAILPYGDEWLIYEAQRGLLLRRRGEVSAFAPAASRWLAENRFSVGAVLPDGRWALGTLRGGVMILNADGTIDRIVDMRSGLPDQHVKSLFVDRGGALWLGLNNGLARIEISAPLTVLDSRVGLRGGVNRVGRLDGALTVATSNGVFVMDASDDLLTDTGRFVALPQPAASAWDIEPVERGALVGTSEGIGLIDRDDRSWSLIEGTEHVTAYELVRSLDPGKIWVGTRRGLGVLELEGSEWVWREQFEGSPPYVRSIVEAEPGSVLVGTIFDGLAWFDLRGPAVRVETLGEGEIGIFRVHDGLFLTGWEGGIARLDPATRAVTPDERLTDFVRDEIVFQLVMDREGNLWMNTTPPTVAISKGDGTFEPVPQKVWEIPARDIQMLMAESSGVVWIGGEQGLFRWSGPFENRRDGLTQPIISRVVVGDQLLDGGYRPHTEPVELGIDFGRIRFEVAEGVRFPDAEYQFRLDPLDLEWGEWTDTPHVEFTSLWEGDYAFSARSRNSAGEISAPVVWSFTVLPPWYRTPAAYLAWVILGLLLFYAVSRARNHGLMVRARKLEDVVETRTIELTRAFNELELARDEVVRKNRMLEEANERLERLARHDPLTGVGNRRHLEDVLEEEWRRAHRTGQELSCVLLDLDRFKALNDSLGHREGDRYLQKVGELLREQVRRGGDFVARYGGEEFVILLPNTTTKGAHGFAEGLREKIADLGQSVTVHGITPLTASFGVATRRPETGGSSDELIEAADRALYLAKERGRNRVEIDQE